MASSTKELYQSAMDLNDHDRAELVGMLLESLDLQVEDGVEAAWLSEIERRVEDIDSGAVEPVPWTEVRSRVFELSVPGTT